MGKQFATRVIRQAQYQSLPPSDLRRDSSSLSPVFHSAAETELDDIESSEDKEPTWRERLAYWLDQSVYGRWWDLLDAVLNVMFVCSYIWLTAFQTAPRGTNKPIPGPPSYALAIDYSIGLLLLLQWLPRLYVAPDTLKALRSRLTLCSLAVTLPLCWTYVSVESNTFVDGGLLVFLYPFRFWRLHLSLLRVVNAVLTVRLTALTKEFLKLGVSIMDVLMGIASFVHVWLYVVQRYYDLSYFDVFYSITMASTSGLTTSIVPDNTVSRVITLGLMVVGSIFIPRKLAELLLFMSELSSYDRPFSGADRHVLLLGEFNTALLKDFFREFYAEDHGFRAMTTRIVMLNPDEPSQSLKTLLADPMYAARVRYVKGSAMSLRSISKVKAHAAHAAFIVSCRHNAVEPFEQDANNIMRALALRKYNHKIKIYTNILLPPNKAHVAQIADEIVCIDEFLLGLLAQNALAPGTTTLIYLLSTSFSTRAIDQYKLNNQSEWIREYLDGASNEIYTVTVSQRFAGHLFSSAAAQIFKQYNSILLGIVLHNIDKDSDASHSDDSDFRILFNPLKYRFQGGETVFIITSENDVADSIALNGVDDGDVHLGFNTFPSNVFLSPLQVDEHIKTVLESNAATLQPVETESSEDIQNGYNSDVSASHFDSFDKSSGASSRLLTRDSSSSSKTAKKKPVSTDDLIVLGNTRNASETEEPTAETVLQNSSVVPVAVSAAAAAAVQSESKKKHSMLSKVFRASSTPGSPLLRSDSLSHPAPPFDSKGGLPDDLSRHIIVCSMGDEFPMNMTYFLAPIRQKSLDTPVVFLSKSAPSEHIRRRLDAFMNVYFVEGTPLDRRDLKAANIFSASTIIILANPNRQSVSTRTADSPVLLALLNIQALTGAAAEEAEAKGTQTAKVYMMAEFIHRENMQFVGSSNHLLNQFNLLRSNNFSAINEIHTENLIPAFVGGQVFSQTLLRSILVQCHYNKYLVRIIKMFLFNGMSASNSHTQPQPPISQSSSRQSMIFDTGPTDSAAFSNFGIDFLNALTPENKDVLSRSTTYGNFYQLSLPRDGRFSGLTYGTLYTYMLSRYQALCLGLYRHTSDNIKAKDAADAAQSARHADSAPRRKPSGVHNIRYVVLNPRAEVVVRDDDALYVLTETRVDWK